MKVCDFTNTEFGLLVKHSPHWVKESNDKPDRHKIGMVVERRFYAEKLSGVLCWPVVQWEGSPMGHACHPANIVPYRKRERDKVRWKEIQDC